MSGEPLVQPWATPIFLVLSCFLKIRRKEVGWRSDAQSLRQRRADVEYDIVLSLLSILCACPEPASVTLVPKQHCFRAPVMDLIANGERNCHIPLPSAPLQLGAFRALEHCLMPMEEEPPGTKLLSLCIYIYETTWRLTEMLKKPILGD